MGKANEILVISLAVLLDIILTVISPVFLLPDIAAPSYIFRLMVPSVNKGKHA